MVHGPVHPIDCLPHRPPFLFLDQILRIEDGKSAAGWKRVSESDCQGETTFPATLVVEAMAQTSAALLFGAGEGAGEEEVEGVGALAAVPRMEFHRSVVAGDTLVATVELVRRLGSMCRFEVKAEVAGGVVAEGVLVVATPGGGAWNP